MFEFGGDRLGAPGAGSCGEGPQAAAQPGGDRTCGGSAELKAIHEILTNPVFAGAFVYGRKRRRSAWTRDGPRAPAPGAA